jgi:hypothetical protein
MNLHLPPNYRINTIATRPDGSACVVLGYTPCGDFYSSLETATLGWFATEQEAITETQTYLDTYGDETMNVLKATTTLFPHIKAEMLEKPICLHLSGNFREVLPERGAQNQKSRLEIYFLNNSKTAVVNAAQVLKIVDMYGAESDAWQGQPVILYAEQVQAFGQTHNVIRIANMEKPDEKRLYGQYLKPAIDTSAPAINNGAPAKRGKKVEPLPQIDFDDEPEPEPDTIDFETGELIPTTATNVSAYATQ